jgi:hypothetical protein
MHLDAKVAKEVASALAILLNRDPLSVTKVTKIK